jgi:hypothetical protein
VDRFLPLGVDDPTGSPSGRTRGLDGCTSTPERSHSASLLGAPCSGPQQPTTRTTEARQEAASARLQAKRGVKVAHYREPTL